MPVKAIWLIVVPGTLAAGVYGAQGGRLSVNSLHHQTVDDVGTGLVVGARSPDGTVEALELPGRPVLAVQWHPEMLRPLPDPGFEWLVAQAASVARRRGW